MTGFMMAHPFISLFMVWAVVGIIPRSIAAWKTGKVTTLFTVQTKCDKCQK